MAKGKSSGATMMARNAGAGVAFARMMRAGTFKQAIVYVEGISDINFYTWLIDCKNVDLQPMDGKADAVDAVERANHANKKGILAMVDSDFDYLLSIQHQPNIILTDTHDIETLMYKDDAFMFSAKSFVDTRKLNTSNYNEDTLWEEAIEITCRIGRLRLLSMQNNWNLNFKAAEEYLEELIQLKNGCINFDIRQYAWECCNQSSLQKPFKEIWEAYEANTESYDCWHLCRGHDLSKIISIIYSSAMFGRRRVYPPEIENVISSTYIASRKFKKTQMYQTIKQWQQNNIGWKILSDQLM